jgi:hypothetical protein
MSKKGIAWPAYNETPKNRDPSQDKAWERGNDPAINKNRDTSGDDFMRDYMDNRK